MSTPARRGGAHRASGGARARFAKRPWFVGAAIVALAGLGTTGYVALSNNAGSDSHRDGSPAVTGPSSGQNRDTNAIVLAADHPPARAGSAPCTQVRVLASLENADLLRALASSYHGERRNVAGRCVAISVTADKSGLAQSDVVQGFPALPAARRPTLWVPDSSAWLALARKDGTGGPAALGDGQSIARSGLALAMPASLAETIGWAAKAPTWAQIFATAADTNAWASRGHPEWGGFKLGKTNPQMATSGLLGMAASYGVAAGRLDALTEDDLDRPDLVAKVQHAELSVTHYMATPEHFLWHVRQAADSGSAAEFLSAVIVDEKSVWDYNRGLSSRDGITAQLLRPPKEPLVPVYPSDGSFIADSPASVLHASWVSPAQRAASADFVNYARTVQGQAVVRAHGYRDVTGHVDRTVLTTGHYESSVTGLRLPPASVLSGIVEDFPTVRKRARVLFLLDASGSMGETIGPGLTRIAAAKQAMTAALQHFTDGDQVGLAAFSNRTGRAIEPGLVAPIAPLGPGRAGLLRALAGLEPISQTPLFAAVQQQALAMAGGWRPDMINAVVLLSDGRNESNIAGSLPELTDTLRKLHHEKPVLVFTLAYGKDADVATLQAISKATGAHYYDATDTATITRVLGDLVTSF